jgi:hypothetical protein
MKEFRYQRWMNENGTRLKIVKGTIITFCKLIVIINLIQSAEIFRIEILTVKSRIENEIN